MGEFIEPEGDEVILKPKVFTEEFITSVVKKSIENGDINENDKLTFVGLVDEKGVKAVVAVNIIDKSTFQIKLNGIFEHEWTGDNKIGAKVIFSVR